MKTTNFSKFLMLAFATTSLLLTSCKPDETIPTPVVKTYAKVMLYHGATDAAGVQLLVDGTAKTTDSVKYNAVTPYYQVEVTGKKNAVSAKNAIINALDSVLVAKDVAYSYFLYQENDAAKTVAIIKAIDDLALPTAGKGRIRLVDLIPDYSGIDVEAVKAGAPATAASTFENVKFKDIRNFVELPAGTYDLKFKLQGQTQLLFTAPNIVITDGKITTLVARGYLNAINTRGAGLAVIANN